MKTPRKRDVTITPGTMMIMSRMQRLLSLDGIKISLNTPDAHWHLIDATEKHSNPLLRQYSDALKDAILFTHKAKHIMAKMQARLEQDGIDINIEDSTAYKKLIEVSEQLKDPELKKLVTQLKAECGMPDDEHTQ